MVLRHAVGVAILSTFASAPAAAQFLEAFEEDRWGVHAWFTPQWRAPDQFRHLVGADEVVGWEGSDYGFGFVRGRATGGEWGLSLVRQRVKADSELCLSAEAGGACADAVESIRGLRLQGFEFHWFAPLATFADDRVQVGVNTSAGAGWYEGSVRRPAVAGGQALEAPDVLRFGGPEGPEGLPVPLFRVEFAMAGVIARGLKVIGSGGYGLHGSRRIGIALSYFPQFGD
ncbi:MAG: hypothetical protein OXH75_06160 [Acidobacteria bacterium]|nr:hypothetical protein [Acidobacteriota bacterium]